VTVITPSTTSSRLKPLLSNAQGFIYYVCRKGITGISEDIPEDFVEKIQAIRQLTTLPIVTGFGLSSQAMISKVLAYTDGFVIGSLFVNAINESCTPLQLKTLVSSLQPREALSC
jgi:tryptophan synthase alpha chain